MKLLLVGPSSKIKDYSKEYFQQKREEGYTIVSYTGSSRYLREIGFTSDYYTFLDPLGIGLDINEYENNEYYSNVKLLIGDLYDDEFRKFFKAGLTCNKLIKKKDLYERVKSLNFVNNFREAHKCETMTLDINKKPNYEKRHDFSKNFILFSGFRKINVDKFTCYFLPLVLYHFKGLTQIRSVGFGDFDVERLVVAKGTLASKKQMTGYSDFKETSKLVAPILMDYMDKNSIDISFENENWFSILLSRIRK